MVSDWRQQTPDEPAPVLDPESPALLRWAEVAATLPGTGLPGTGLPGTGLPGRGVPGTPAVAPRVRTESSNRWAWILASSPVILTLGVIALGAAAGGYSRLELVGVALGALVGGRVLAELDQNELRRRGFDDFTASAWGWLTPVAYLLVRGRRLWRHDIASYHPFFSFFGFVFASLLVLRCAELMVNFLGFMHGLLPGT